MKTLTGIITVWKNAITRKFYIRRANRLGKFYTVQISAYVARSNIYRYADVENQAEFDSLYDRLDSGQKVILFG